MRGCWCVADAIGRALIGELSWYGDGGLSRYSAFVYAGGSIWCGLIVASEHAEIGDVARCAGGV